MAACGVGEPLVTAGERLGKGDNARRGAAGPERRVAPVATPGAGRARTLSDPRPTGAAGRPGSLVARIRHAPAGERRSARATTSRLRERAAGRRVGGNH